MSLLPSLDAVAVVVAVMLAAICFPFLGCDNKVAGGRVDGVEIFSEVCARCHGPNGEPNASMIARYGVKNLRSAKVQTELKDADIRRQILNGSKNKQMPSFDGAISEPQITAVIAHIRTFGVATPAKPNSPTKPNPATKK